MLFSVCVDPGHGGYDPGAVGNGLQEKDITLAISLELAHLLVFNGIGVAMTRTGDYAPGNFENQITNELMERVRISDNYGADLFVSIHINAGGGTGEEELVIGLGGNAEKAANKLLPYLVGVGGWPDRHVKQQNVLVLAKTIAPAILTENGFIDSVNDSSKLKDAGFIHSLAVAHAKGICDYFGVVYREPEVKPLTINPGASPDERINQAIGFMSQAIKVLRG